MLNPAPIATLNIEKKKNMLLEEKKITFSRFVFKYQIYTPVYNIMSWQPLDALSELGGS